MSDELKQVANGCDVRVKSFTGYDVNGYRSTQQVTSRFGPNEKPQIAEFVRPALMASTIMVELRKSMNSHFMETNLLNMSCSNATGLILDQQDEPLILG